MINLAYVNEVCKSFEDCLKECSQGHYPQAKKAMDTALAYNFLSQAPGFSLDLICLDPPEKILFINELDLDFYYPERVRRGRKLFLSELENTTGLYTSQKSHIFMGQERHIFLLEQIIPIKKEKLFKLGFELLDS